MLRYDIYYSTKDRQIERKNVSKDEMQSFLNNLQEKGDHLLRISKVGNERKSDELER